jgi:UDP-GlcNAc:undecaprenyl-phosphate GlcNAc-1-phosphate transferase
MMGPGLGLYLLGAVAALGLGLLFTGLAIPVAFRLRAFDRPGHRKTHTHVVPYLGGCAVFLALVLSLVLLSWAQASALSLPSLAVCLLPAVLAMVLGLVDDLRDVRAAVKLGLQGAMALVFSLFAYRFQVLHVPGLPPLDLGWTAVPVTTFFILAVVNGSNMIDGSDGLYASASAASFACVAVAASGLDQPSLTLLACCACGACLGFLAWNRPPAKIYLGDAGSQGLGFLLAGMLVALGGGEPGAQFLALSGRAWQPYHYQLPLAVLIAGYPALEVMLSVLRRGLQGRHLFRGDQGHLHHRLSRLGLRPLGIAAAAAAFNLLSGGIALAFLAHEKGQALVMALLLAGLLGVVLPWLGFARFFQRRWLRERRPSFAMAHHFAAMQSAKLDLAQDAGEVLDLLVQACHEFGFVRCRLSLPQRLGGPRGWVWDWRCPGQEEHQGLLEHVQVHAVGSAAWVSAIRGGEAELVMESRVLSSELMVKILRRVHQLSLRLPLVSLPNLSELLVAGPPAMVEWRDRLGQFAPPQGAGTAP